MRAVRSIRQRALVIGLLPLGESDLLIRSLVQGLGKISLAARHARKGSKRFGLQIDLFDHGHIEADAGRGGLWSLQSFTQEASFRNLRGSLEKLTAASMLCETFDGLLVEYTPGEFLEQQREQNETSDSEPQAILSESDQTDAFDALMLGLSLVDGAANAKELLQALFDALTKILAETGFGDRAEFLPRGTQSLAQIVQRIQEATERPLKSSTSLPLLIDALRRDSSS